VSFKTDNADYEAWLRTRCTVVDADLRLKHRKMAKDAFSLLRGSYFRWARRIESLCPDLTEAPQVMAVGDSHLENFGAWRDGEGRWVWGVNDFDEAAVMPYPFDLVRLAASARLIPRLAVGRRAAADAILVGYGRGLATPSPTLLDRGHDELRAFVDEKSGDHRKFWSELQDEPPGEPPLEVRRALKNSLPAGTTSVRFSLRAAGCGSLGRPRFVGLGEWQGGPVAREAKASLPSAWDWAHGAADEPRTLDPAAGPFRSPDPSLRVEKGFVLRRLAPDARKIELGDLGAGLTSRVLGAMGFELASVHAGDKAHIRAVKADFARRPSDWLQIAAKAAAKAVEADYQEWTSIARK
jgi:hypothetical protein